MNSNIREFIADLLVKTLGRSDIQPGPDASGEGDLAAGGQVLNQLC